MLIAHTSDWHLGRTLHCADLSDAQQQFIDFLVELVAVRKVDVVLVSGDVYDRAIPPVTAVKMLSDALSRLSQHARVIVTAGNHDSGTRLGFGADLMQRVFIRTAITEVGTPIVIDKVAFYPLPYLEPDAARKLLAEQAVGDSLGEGKVVAEEPRQSPVEKGKVRPEELSAGEVPAQKLLPRTHDAVIGAALARVHRDRATKPHLRTVVMAHAFVAGGEPCQSERDIQVGGVQWASASHFAGIDYVALGHLHSPQRVTAKVPTSTHIRYCGSPIAYSFSEAGQEKSIALVSIPEGSVAESEAVSVELVPTPVFRKLTTLRGELAEVLASACIDDWIRAEVVQADRPPQLGARLKARFPRLLQYSFTSTAVPDTAAPEVATISPLEVATDFIAYAGGAPATEQEVAVLADAFTAVGSEGQ